MQQLVLTEEQTEFLTSAQIPIKVRDACGNLVGLLSPIWTEEDIQAAKRTLSSNQPRYTTKQVLEHLNSLESK